MPLWIFYTLIIASALIGSAFGTAAVLAVFCEKRTERSEAGCADEQL